MLDIHSIPSYLLPGFAPASRKKPSTIGPGCSGNAAAENEPGRFVAAGVSLCVSKLWGYKPCNNGILMRINGYGNHRANIKYLSYLFVFAVDFFSLIGSPYVSQCCHITWGSRWFRRNTFWGTPNSSLRVCGTRKMGGVPNIKYYSVYN